MGWLRSRAVPIGATPAAGHATANWEQRVGLLAGVFVCYGLGALVGGILQARSSPLVTAVPLVAVVFVVVSARPRARRR